MSSLKRNHIPKKVKDRVKARFEGRCGYCGELSSRLQVDHRTPVVSINKTSDNEANLMPACVSCNNFKGGMDVEEFRRSLQENPRKAYDYSVNHRFAVKFKQIRVIDIPIVFYYEKVAQGVLNEEMPSL